MERKRKGGKEGMREKESIILLFPCVKICRAIEGQVEIIDVDGSYPYKEQKAPGYSLTNFPLQTPVAPLSG